MNKKSIGLRVHRFREYVAVSVGDGSTVYIPHDAAHHLAEILTACSRDIRENKFAESRFSTWEQSYQGAQ